MYKISLLIVFEVFEAEFLNANAFTNFNVRLYEIPKLKYVSIGL